MIGGVGCRVGGRSDVCVYSDTLLAVPDASFSVALSVSSFGYSTSSDTLQEVLLKQWDTLAAARYKSQGVTLSLQLSADNAYLWHEEYK